ncbi:hypothetical protein ACLOJK_032271 [Asimina triloba]
MIRLGCNEFKRMCGYTYRSGEITERCFIAGHVDLIDKIAFSMPENRILKGVSLGEGTGATMSDDEDELQMDSALDTGADGHDMMGFGPLIPTDSERSLMERVRHELKIELKQGFKSRIEDVREEILRKRRAGKLPGDTTLVLKNWWQQHSKWPYPTEEDKAKLVEETGLQLKQINNWFINQRKRNWHSNPQSMNALKSKRKRTAQEELILVSYILVKASRVAGFCSLALHMCMHARSTTEASRLAGRWCAENKLARTFFVNSQYTLPILHQTHKSSKHPAVMAPLLYIIDGMRPIQRISFHIVRAK